MRKLVCFFVIFTLLTSACFAQDAGKKLIRGVGNILTGCLEIPVNVYQTSKEKNVFIGLTWGLIKGLGMSVVRTAAGVYDTLTFPFPLPESYKPVMEPEFVFSSNSSK
jgi:putative exosortase-associated protein (TIGR04073 family)